MKTSTHAPPQDWPEGRRLRAWELFQEGWKAVRIAEALNVTRGAVSQWVKRGREGGPEALRTRPRPGRQPRLTAAQRAALPTLLTRGAESYDFIGDLWTTTRVALVIRRAFGVSYHPAHVSRVLRQIGWTLQKPSQRASQRDAAKVAAWREETWPALQAKPATRAGQSCS